MKFKEIIDKILNEERNGGEFDRYQVEVGEDEGKHLFSFFIFSMSIILFIEPK